MTGWAFVIAVSALISITALLVWYRVTQSKERALALTVCSAVLASPLITFGTLGARLEFDWRDLGDSPADGLVLLLGSVETVRIWIGSIVFIATAHLTVMDRYSDHFHRDDELSEFE